jgi:hypothetical protein
VTRRVPLIRIAAAVAIVAGFTIATPLWGTPRPDPGRWYADFAALAERVSDAGNSPGHEVCQQMLADLREAAEALLPSPNQALDGTVVEWIETAENTFFECAPVAPSASGHQPRLVDLELLTAEIDAAAMTLLDALPDQSLLDAVAGGVQKAGPGRIDEGLGAALRPQSPVEVTQ